jgi:hypothetical protein
MTKKLQYIFIVLAASLCGFAACNDDDNNVDYTKYYDWRDQNSQLTRDLLADIRELGDDAYFTDSVPSITEPYAYCTVRRAIKTANEDSLRAIHKWFSPYYTSTLKVHYTLFNPDSVWARFEQYDVLDNQSQRNNPDVMNKIFGLGYKATDPEYVIKADTLESYQVEYYSNFTPGSVIKGWSDCLQQMHIGDCWLIHIPWYLAYGQSGSGSKIDPYSNLIFILELVDITSWGGNVDEGED